MHSSISEIWVDADSCPRRAREIIARAAERCGVRAYYLANREIPLPACELVRMVVVSGEPEAVDGRIVADAPADALVVTRDIPLAAQLVDRGLVVLNDRGEVFSAENVGERLSIRNFSRELREAGLYRAAGGGYDNRAVQAFANALDRELRRGR